MSNITGPGKFSFDPATTALLTSGGGGGGTTDANITQVNGTPVAVGNPLPVELSDGTNPFGTPTNPINIAGAISATNPSVGTTGAAAPTSATEMGIVVGANLQAVSAANPVPVSMATAPSTPVTNAGLTNIDVALSTRTKPADQQHTILDSGTLTSITNPVTVTGTVTETPPYTLGQKAMASSVPVVIASDQSGVPVTNAGLTNLDVALSTRLKPADTLAAVTSITNPVTVAQAAAANLNATITGSVGVNNFPATQPVSVASLPLPANAAQETGGNLATMVSLLQTMESLLQYQREQLAVLKAIQFQQASVFGNHVDSNQFLEPIPLN